MRTEGSQITDRIYAGSQLRCSSDFRLLCLFFPLAILIETPTRPHDRLISQLAERKITQTQFKYIPITARC